MNEDTDCVYFFGSEHSSSAAGELLAKSVASETGAAVEPRASAMLKETRAPAVVVSRHHLDEAVGKAVVTGLVGFFATAGSSATR